MLGTHGRAPLSGIITIPLQRSQRIVLACVKQNSLHLCVRVVTANLLRANEDWGKKNRSEECVGSKVTLLSVLPNLQELRCQSYHFRRA